MHKSSITLCSIEICDLLERIKFINPQVRHLFSQRSIQTYFTYNLFIMYSLLKSNWLIFSLKLTVVKSNKKKSLIDYNLLKMFFMVN